MSDPLTQAPRRRERGPKPLSEQIAATARAIFRKRGFQQVHILRNWAAIVGDGLASMSAPEKLSFPRAKGDEQRRAEGGTLTVRVDGPMALEFTHQEPQILERINSYYGYRAVTRLKLVQAPLPQPRLRRKRSFRALTAKEEEALRLETGALESPELQASLEALGRRVLGSRRKPPQR